jgi:uncharacterized OsmC-like protein
MNAQTNAAAPNPKPAKANKERKPAQARNGVDTPTLFATIDAVAGRRELAQFKFRATNKWLAGTHSQSEMSWYAGAGGEHEHKQTFTADADHPAVLVGEDNGPSPVEWVLHALAGCLTAGIANIASARGVNLESCESTVEGDINLLGLLGIDKTVRNGFSGIRVSFKIKGDAPAEKLEQIIEQSKARSAVYDILTNGLPVTIDVEAS